MIEYMEIRCIYRIILQKLLQVCGAAAQNRPHMPRFSLLGQYRIIEQERFASKFCVLTRRGFAVILDVLP